MINSQFKLAVDDFEVEFAVEPISIDSRRIEINKKISNIEEQLDINLQKIEELNTDIDRLTNHADGLDYTVAVASGIIAGIIDSFWVGEFSIDRANEWGDEKVNNFVVKIAQKQGYKGDDLPGAIEFLEKKYKIPADEATNVFGGGKQHHLRDFSHHPTPIGLIFSLLTQFTKNIYGTDVAGVFKVVPVEDTTLIGKNLPEKITFGVINWFFHMVSDMAGSSSSVKKGSSGTGLPGPLVSFLKEVSALPIFKKLDKNRNKELSVWISQLFNGTLLGKRDENGKLIEAVKFDLRTEIGVLHEIGRQAVPVIINECVVRAFYFLRRLFRELNDNKIKSISDFKNINWENTLPFKNRTVVRMLTISTGTFTAFDLADAAIRSIVESGGLNPETLRKFLLKVNFVGVGRFAIAIGTDVGMGIKRSARRNERIEIYNQQLHLLNAKVFYYQADMWISAEDTEKSIEELYEIAEESIRFTFESIAEIEENLNKIDNHLEKAEQNNPGLSQEMLDILNWG